MFEISRVDSKIEYSFTCVKNIARFFGFLDSQDIKEVGTIKTPIQIAENLINGFFTQTKLMTNFF